jgi:hypothetical protein
MVIIKAASGILKVTAEAHGSRVGFFHPNDEEITSKKLATT